MAKELYDGIYSSHRLIFIERVQSNIDRYLKDRISRSYRAGQEIICHLAARDLEAVLKELIENPEFNINILNNIAKFSNGYGDYALVSLASSNNNYSMSLKIKLGPIDMEGQFRDILDKVNGHFKSARNYFISKKQKLDISRNSDLIIHNQSLEGLDCFDVYIQSDSDVVEDVFFSDKIAESINLDFFRGVEIMNIIAKIGVFDWKAAIFPELCLCMNLEELLQIKVPKRVQSIRALISELFRISSHLSCLSNLTKLLEYDLAYDLLAMEKERVLRSIELMTGSRVFPNFIRIGGVRKDLSEDMEQNLRTVLPVLFNNILKAQTRLFDSSIIIKRLRDKGILDVGKALKNGVTGPNLRSAGIRYDMRKNRNLLNYKDISFVIPTGKHSDCLDRVAIRFQEIFQSLKIIKQIIQNMPDEYYRPLGKTSNFDFEHTSMVSSVECPHGDFKIYLEVEGNKIISLVVMGPSRNSVFTAYDVLEGESIEDINLILSTLDISPGELLH